ncbi:MAG: preprotein translocase subunit SecE [Halobacteriovoraceae bacterium]|nr:preprotein translocase subunit SecE [Halobacteriovoraceae bacterium]
MPLIKTEDQKKWINAFVVLVSVISGYLTIKGTIQVGEWLDLEAKYQYFMATVQGTGILAGLAAFLIIHRNKTSSSYLRECYSELVKVIWPDRESVVKTTIIILIGVTIISLIFLGMDVVFRKLLELVY